MMSYNSIAFIFYTMRADESDTNISQAKIFLLRALKNITLTLHLFHWRFHPKQRTIIAYWRSLE